MSLTLGTDTATTSPTERSTPTSTSSAPNRPTNPFATDASPALILAFLALGIFAGGFLCMLFLRRYGVGCIWRERRLEIVARESEVRNWAADVAEARDQQPRKQKKPLGPKPTLWDMKSTPLYSDMNDKRLRWRTMQPLSVQYTHFVVQYEGDMRILDTHDDVPSRPEPPKSRIQSLTRWFRRQSPSDAPPRQHSRNDSSADSAQLHIAVTVAMPSPSRREPTLADIPVYELGLTTVSWDAEKAPLEVDADGSPQVRTLLRNNGFL